jgi:archaellum component FlaF (FlaF/FlaG flagellin family)
MATVLGYPALKGRAVSSFIATAILIVATLVVGGIFFEQITDYVDAGTRNPSLSLVGYSVSPDLTTFILTIRNDGNVNVNLTESVVKVNGNSYTFTTEDRTPTFVISLGPLIRPGEEANIGYEFSNGVDFRLSPGDVIYVTLVGDVISKTLSITV